MPRKAKNRLAEARAAADRDDPNWRIDDLMAHREQVPDAENSAKVVARLVSLLPGTWPPAPKPSSVASRTKPSAAVNAYDQMMKGADNVKIDETVAAAPRRDELKRATRQSRSLAPWRISAGGGMS